MSCISHIGYRTIEYTRNRFSFVIRQRPRRRLRRCCYVLYLSQYFVCIIDPVLPFFATRPATIDDSEHARGAPTGKMRYLAPDDFYRVHGLLTMRYHVPSLSTKVRRPCRDKRNWLSCLPIF